MYPTDIIVFRKYDSCKDSYVMKNIDIIGDIHGHADELEALLGRLGYLDKAGRYRSRIVNGPEARLPDGHNYPAADGTLRREIRVRWWKNLRDASYREAIFPPSNAVPDWSMG